MHRRPLVLALGMGALLLGASVGPAFAAILLQTLSADAGPPGLEVTLQVEITGREAGTGALHLVPGETYTQPTPCEQLEGATVLGVMTWQQGAIEYEGRSYPGAIAEMTFTVPDVAAGAYYLAESRPDPYTACFVFAPFTVTSDPMPDTAMRTPQNELFGVGAVAVLVSVTLAAWRRLATQA